MPHQGNILKAILTERGISHKQLGDAIGMKRNTTSNRLKDYVLKPEFIKEVEAFLKIDLGAQLARGASVGEENYNLNESLLRLVKVQEELVEAQKQIIALQTELQAAKLEIIELHTSKNER